MELCATTNINGSIDDHALESKDLIIQAAESTIPKTKPHKKKRNYWCYNNEVKAAKWSVNRAIKKLRHKKKIWLP